MNSKLVLLVVFIGALSCKKSEDGAASATAPLIGEVDTPDGFTFERRDLKGIGTIELPTGSDWKKSSGELYNKKLDATIAIQHQSGGFSDRQKEYADSYNSVNEESAPKWKRGSDKSGSLSGVPAMITGGTFDDGTAYSVRDILFYAPDETVMLQTRIADENKDKLIPLVDYMGSTFQKK